MASAPLPAPQASAYWPPLQIGGVAIDLTHLNPFQLGFASERLKRDLRIDVTFTNHCFTDHFLDGVHDPAWKIMDHKRERVFCFTRHTMSRLLPEMVRQLPGAKVTQARQDRNHVYVAHLGDEAGHHYPMFFRLEKVKARGRDLTLTVESAYTCTAFEMRRKLEGGRAIAFAVLAAKVFEERPTLARGRR